MKSILVASVVLLQLYCTDTSVFELGRLPGTHTASTLCVVPLQQHECGGQEQSLPAQSAGYSVA